LPVFDDHAGVGVCPSSVPSRIRAGISTWASERNQPSERTSFHRSWPGVKEQYKTMELTIYMFMIIAF
jgi:hypothetical protein